MSQEENTAEYMALKAEMEQGEDSSRKFQKCKSLLFEGYVLPVEPSKQEMDELESWLKRVDYLNFKGEQDPQASFAFFFPKLTYELNERAKAKTTR